MHQTDISRFSAAYTAFMLGISNMRRRKLRTNLTLGTITLLTFTVLSFSSFKPDVRFFAFSHGHEGAYEGALIRHPQLGLDRKGGRWRRRGPTSENARSCRHATGTSPTPLRKRSTFRSAKGRRSSLASAMLGLAPQEHGITGIHTALVSGRLFRVLRGEELPAPGRNGRRSWVSVRRPAPRRQRTHPGDHAASSGSFRFRGFFRSSRPRQRAFDSRSIFTAPRWS